MSMGISELEKKKLHDNSLEKESLAERLNNLDIYFADNMLSDELKEIYAKIQYNCLDFRQNVFFKKIDMIEQNFGKSSITNTNYNKKQSDEEHWKKLLEVKTYDEMLREFTEEA